MDFPMPPNTPPPKTKGSGELTENESTYIMECTLKNHHKNKPHVITFIETFCRCRSISQAAHEAGISNSLGYKLRHRHDVVACINKITNKSAIKYGFDQAEVFERVKEVVTFDPIMLQNPDGTFKSNLHDIEPEARRCLKKLECHNLYNQETDKNGMSKKIIIGKVIKYEFYDKLKGAELVGREKEMFKNTTKVEHTMTSDMKTILLDSAKRADDRVLVEDKTTTVLNANGEPV